MNRRSLPDRERIAWVALVALVPGIGFFAYGLARALALLFSPNHSTKQEDKPKRSTMLKRPPKPAPRTGTIAGIDLLKETIPDAAPLYQPGNASAITPFFLEVLEGPHAGGRFTVERLPASIGRGDQVPIRLDNDLGVSRQHAEFYQQGGVLRIRDLRSTHGTQVNGFSIDDKALELGDKIQIGLSVLLVKKNLS